MDIPLSGALFITNPRRRNKRRMPTRDNGAKDRFIARTLGKPLKSVQGQKKRNYAAYQQLFKEAGGDSAFRKYKAKGVRTRKAVKAGTYSHTTWGKGKKSSSKSKSTRKNPDMKNNPRTIWHKYLRAMKGKGYTMSELRAGYKTLLKRYPNGRGLIGAARKLKPKAHAAKSKTQRAAAKKARAVRKLKAKRGRDGRMRYYGYRNGKYGLISKAAYTRRKKLRKKPSRRRQAVSRKRTRKSTRRPAQTVSRAVKKMKRVRRKDGKGFMYFGYRNGRYGMISKKQYERRMRLGAARRAKPGATLFGRIIGNPGKRKNRRNPRKSGFGALALRKNPGVLGLLDSAGGAVSRVPLVGGFLGPKVAPLGLGLAVGAVHFYALRYLGPKLPDFGAQIGGLLGRESQGYDLGLKAQKFGYSIGGVAVATALQAGRRFAPKLFPANTVNVLSTGALLVGAAVDFLDYMRGGDASEASIDADFIGDDMGLSGLAYTGGDLNGMHMNGAHLNGMHMNGAHLNGMHMNGAHMNGLAYTGGQLNGAHLNGMHMNGAHLNGAHLNGAHDLMAAYQGAHMSDAAFSGHDFDPAEGQALMMGPMAFKDRFGMPARGMMRSSGRSSMAGRPGHRWAWLVKLIGFDRTARLAAMPPKKRCAIIAKLRREAMALVDRRTDLSGVAYRGGALNGLAYTGGQLNGLAYTGGQLNGLAYTGGQL